MHALLKNVCRGPHQPTHGGNVDVAVVVVAVVIVVVVIVVVVLVVVNVIVYSRLARLFLFLAAKKFVGCFLKVWKNWYSYIIVSK